MLELIQSFYRYNSQSITRLLAACGRLTLEQFTAPGCSGHGSIQNTLTHLLTTQKGYVSWFDGSMSPADAYARARNPRQESFSLDEARHFWAHLDPQTNRFIETLTEEKLRKELSWAPPGGTRISLPLWEVLLHVANHGTHHRGQIISAIRNAGHEPGTYEFLFFALGEKGMMPGAPSR